MEFITQNWELIVGAITAVASWYGSRALKDLQLRKTEAETTSSELESISSNFKVYQDLINDLEHRFKKRIEELEGDLERMSVLNTELRKAVSSQEKYINKLKSKLEYYEGLGE